MAHLPQTAGHPLLSRHSHFKFPACAAGAAVLLLLAGAPAKAQDSPNLAALFDSAASMIKLSFYDPTFGGKNVDTIASFRRRSFLPPAHSADLIGEVNGLLTEIGHSGSRFYKEGDAPDFRPGFHGRLTEDGFVATQVIPGSDCQAAGLLPGDIITTPPSQFDGTRGSNMVLRVRSTLGEWSRLVRRTGDDIPEPDYGWRTLYPTVAYLKIRRLDDADGLDSAMAQVRSFPGLVLDVRSLHRSDAGVLRLLGYFADSPAVVGYCLNRSGMERLKVPLSRSIPSRLAENTGDVSNFNPTLSERGLLALRVLPLPSGAYKGRVVVLADEGTSGFAEFIPEWFEMSRKGRVIGRITAGIGGIPSALKMEGGYTLEVPTAALFRADGLPLERHGFEPQLPVEWRQLDVKASADPDVERAMELLHPEEEE